MRIVAACLIEPYLKLKNSETWAVLEQIVSEWGWLDRMLTVILSLWYLTLLPLHQLIGILHLRQLAIKCPGNY
jgi:hypothetical protein